jgi:hypothetical protein
MYIKIANQSDMVPRLALEKLGLSTKRNDPSTIGQFGSGIKYAPIAALRMGIDWVFAGCDEKGGYLLRYSAQEEDGINCIVYDYGNYTKPSSFTVDAGVLSWEDEFQIYREAVSNAIDESTLTNTRWYKSIVDPSEVKVNYGEFAIYIEATPSMVFHYNNHAKYFLEEVENERELLYTSGSGYIQTHFWSKIGPGLNVYTKKVLVHDNEEMDALFDYEIPSLRLNEQRTVSDEYQMRYILGSAIAKCSDGYIIDKFISAAINGDSVYELDHVEFHGTEHEVSNQWLVEWNEIAGENCLMLSAEEYLSIGIRDYITELGRKCKVVKSPLIWNILLGAGVSTLKTIAGESINFDIDYDISKYPKLIEAIKIAARFEPKINDISDRIYCFTPKQNHKYLGLVIDKNTANKRILIDKSHAINDQIQEIVATLIHEFDHFDTGYGDGDTEGRKFRELADRRIGKMMMEFYRPNLVSVNGDNVVIDVENISNIGGVKYEIVSNEEMKHYLLFIGKKVFKINGKFSFGQKFTSGQALPNEDGTKFVINIPGIEEADIIC